MICSLEMDLGKPAAINHQPTIAADSVDRGAEVCQAARHFVWKFTIPEEGFKLTAQWHAENAKWLDENRP